MMKTKHNKPVAKITITRKQFKVFSLRPEARQRYPCFSLLFNIVLQALARAVRGGNKAIQIERGEVKVYLLMMCFVIYETLKTLINSWGW